MSKGYQLADPQLCDGSDNISDLEFILGTNSSHLLLEEQVTFGKDNDSVFSKTAAGVLLFGNVRKMLSNIYHLNNNSVYCNTIYVNNVLCAKSDSEAHPALESENHLPSEVSSSNVMVNVGMNDNDVDALTDKLMNTLNYDDYYFEEASTEVDGSVIDYILCNTKRQEDGRLIMPLPWRYEALHLLGSNFTLAKIILNSQHRKYLKFPEKLAMIDEVFKQQEETGIIERESKMLIS